MNFTPPSLRHFAGAISIYPFIGGDTTFAALRNDGDFMKRFKATPCELTPKETDERLRNHLATWGMRHIPSGICSGKIITQRLRDCSLLIHEQKNWRLEDVIGNSQKEDVVRTLFTKLTDLTFPKKDNSNCSLGIVAASKILGLLNDNLFVMWDKPISKHYEVTKDSTGYHQFLIIMNKFSKTLEKEYQGIFGKGTLVSFIHNNLSLPFQKTMPKFLDEYNWVTITNEINTTIIDGHINFFTSFSQATPTSFGR